ncbi:hypothetical protein C8T65DRAFT_737991 [Cerioporus squamosus]|nr:hypothetical protein C8T65DRAFT_737991 [Cerioporus squamosus]
MPVASGSLLRRNAFKPDLEPLAVWWRHRGDDCIYVDHPILGRHDYPPSPLSRPASDFTIPDRSPDVDVETGELSPSSDDPEEGDVLITVTDAEGRVRVSERQLERNVLRKKTAARYPQIRHSALARQRRWWKNREVRSTSFHISDARLNPSRYLQKHLILFIVIGTIIVNVLAAVAVIVWGTIYQRTP